MNPWRIAIDTGGTFTDCLAVDPNGIVHRIKVLSTGTLRARIKQRINDRTIELATKWSPGDFLRGMRIAPVDDPIRSAEIESVDGNVATFAEPLPTGFLPNDSSVVIFADEEAPVLAARMVTNTAVGDDLPPIDLRLATTRCTNALLERKGAPVAFFVTRGFGDLLLIGNQTRPNLFALDVRKPARFEETVVEVSERIGADGHVVRPLDEKQLHNDAARAVESGAQTAALALLNSTHNAAHERRAVEILRDAGFELVIASHDMPGDAGILARAETSVVEAYLGPILHGYINRIGSRVQGDRTLMMTSAGGLLPAGAVRATQCLLSGPAGGAVGAAEIARELGLPRVLGFDMGGTSTDVCRIDGDFSYRYEHRIAGAHLLETSIAIETVAAGGGSICGCTHGKLTVGPQSAGADPGPACYSRGGPLTLTDVNLLLGRLVPERFGIPIDRAASERACDTVMRELGALSRESVLEGFLRIADQRVADAIAQVSVREGVDPPDYALVSFGGAGGQHACRVAESLGIKTIIMPADAAILSAVGVSCARISRVIDISVNARLDAFEKTVDDFRQRAERLAHDAFERDGFKTNEIHMARIIARMRLAGQTATLDIDLSDWTGAADKFGQRYRATYGYDPPHSPIEIVDLRIVAAQSKVQSSSRSGFQDYPGSTQDQSRIRMYSGGRFIDVRAFERDLIQPDSHITGPALILSDTSTFVIEDGWSVRVREDQSLIVTRGDSVGDRDHAQDSLDRDNIVTRDLLRYGLESIAIEMGEMLQRTAMSVNVKERRDFSCAILDRDGKLLINAPHMPVHLGALGICVRTIREHINMRPGDVVITNHPACGGSHLPDITIITPIHDENGVIVAYVANRAHHAEIGGTRPGSMPPDASTLAEEGTIIPPTLLLEGGVPRFDGIERLFRAPPYPSRMVEQNLADIRAQVASNRHGFAAIQELIRAEGSGDLIRKMSMIQDHARTLMQGAIESFGDSNFEACDALDDGTPICVSITTASMEDRIVFDFRDSGQAHPGNLNATPAIVRSAVLYVLRLLIGEAFPLAEGFMEHVEIRIPQGVLNPVFHDDPALCPAVVGGNVETSQRIVDVLIKAFGLAAASQGTMNNLLFGDDSFAYYETICGGAGAGPGPPGPPGSPGFPGCDAVHTHMTNTRITDPEVIERHYGVRVERFAIRRGSGGGGEYRGGDGIVREMVFLRPAALSILSQRRTIPPFGLGGGDPGLVGTQRVIRADGSVIRLAGIDSCEMASGDRIIIETPGGGGFGVQSKC